MVVAAGGIAMAANFGVLGVASAGTDSVGTLDANTLAELTTTTQPAPDVVVIDQYDLVPPPAGPGTDDVEGSSDIAPERDAEHADEVDDRQQPGTPQVPSQPPTTAASAPTTTRVEGQHDDDDDIHEVEDHEHETEHEDD